MGAPRSGVIPSAPLYAIAATLFLEVAPALLFVPKSVNVSPREGTTAINAPERQLPSLLNSKKGNNQP